MTRLMQSREAAAAATRAVTRPPKSSRTFLFMQFTSLAKWKKSKKRGGGGGKALKMEMSKEEEALPRQPGNSIQFPNVILMPYFSPCVIKELTEISFLFLLLFFFLTLQGLSSRKVVSFLR